MKKKVSVVSQIYNTKESELRQCIESVLHQTYSDLEFILVDNGCTDGSPEIMREYAERDSRVKIIRFPVNERAARWVNIAKESARGEYLANLDSDDWWEPDYLERLVGFLERNELDIALTGTRMYIEETGETETLRRLDSPAVLTRREFALLYQYYWVFPSTLWASVMKLSLFRKSRFPREKLSYGGDTIYMLYYLAQCERIGVDDSALYRYRIRKNSVSSEYDAQRLYSCVRYADVISAFLRDNQALTVEKEKWLGDVYLSLLIKAAVTLNRSNLPPDDKLRECRRFLEEPRTRAAMKVDTSCREELRRGLLITAINATGNAPQKPDDLSAVAEMLVPNCAAVVTPEFLRLLRTDQPLCDALLQDDVSAVLARLLELLSVDALRTRFDLREMIRALSPDRPLLDTPDEDFLRRHGELYLTLWRGDYAGALDAMTGALLEGAREDEAYLQLYLTLAALENQTAAFVFGKLRLAEAYLRGGEAAKCRAALDELTEMGVEENEDMAALRARLAERG